MINPYLNEMLSNTRDTPNYEIGSELLRLRKRDFIYISSINGTHARQFRIQPCALPAQRARIRSSTFQTISVKYN